jgi:signal peptide peptidase SppA
MTRAITNAAVLMEMEEMGIEAGALDAIVDAEVIDDGDAAAAAAVAVTDAQRDFFGMGSATAAAGHSAGTTKADKKDDDKGAGRMKIEKKSDIMRAVREVEAINTDIFLLELDFVRSVVEVLGPDRADAIRTTIVGNSIGGGAGTLLRTLKERPLASVLSSLHGGTNDGDGGGHHRRKNLYVTRFPGDVTASQLNELREEVTGILRSALPGDEALLVLQSGGGTVTGYGLAAAQLQRFKAKGMRLTVCVEQVAASGGYMMCCTADKIVASPFAVLGSIGVISEIPNAYERLQREGIEFQTITAGKFKRTVTPTKKVTKEDIRKSTEDITEIFNLFKGFVKSQRPQLDIENVATGETWFGEDALERGLCDELGTADDVLLDFIDQGYDVYEVSF